MRPGIIGGHRSERRLVESLWVHLATILRPILPKGLRVNPASEIAAALVDAVVQRRRAVTSDTRAALPANELRRLALNVPATSHRQAKPLDERPRQHTCAKGRRGTGKPHLGPVRRYGPRQCLSLAMFRTIRSPSGVPSRDYNFIQAHAGSISSIQSRSRFDHDL